MCFPTDDIQEFFLYLYAFLYMEPDCEITILFNQFAFISGEINMDWIQCERTII